MKKFKIMDKEAVLYGEDFTFDCGKIPYTITCFKILLHGVNNLIDLDLVNKIKKPLLNIWLRRSHSWLGMLQCWYNWSNNEWTYFSNNLCVSKRKLQRMIHLSYQCQKFVWRLQCCLFSQCQDISKTFKKELGTSSQHCTKIWYIFTAQGSCPPCLILLKHFVQFSNQF